MSRTEKLSRLWSKVVKKRAGGRCEVCYQPGIHAHHPIKRNTNGLKFKYDPNNGVYLCASDHEFFEDNFMLLIECLPPLRRDWFLANYDNKKYEDLDFEKIERELKQELKEMQPIKRKRKNNS